MRKMKGLKNVVAFCAVTGILAFSVCALAAVPIPIIFVIARQDRLRELVPIPPIPPVPITPIPIPITPFPNPVPDTGQTQSYTDTFGEDSDYTINPPSYTKLDAQGNDLPDSASSWSMVKDNVTKLMWEVKTDDGSIHDKDDTYNWDDAQSVFIANLNAENYGGFSDWRLPTVKELLSIVNSETYNPVINTAYFSNTMSFNYWSSTTYADYTGLAWCVYFYYGDVYVDNKSDGCYVRAVRGGQSGPLDNLVINGDGTVTDTSTGLIWQQQTAGEMTWEAAISYCEGLFLGGYNDWRLPNRNELQSLVDYTHYDPAIYTAAFPDTMLSYYWSSTTYADYTYNAWCVYFSNGDVYNDNKSHSYYVRAVRGGQSGPLGNLVIVVGHTQSGGSSGVAIDTVVTVTFNKSMDRTSTEAAFSITPSVSGGITWVDDDKTLTFTPAPNLSPGKEYTVSIASSATDTEGHRLDSNQNGTGGEPEDTYIFSFTTAAVPIPISNFLPDTGQTQSYTYTFGEDSDYTINPPSYTKLDAQGNALPDSASSWSMVKDNVTRLMWEGKTDDGSIHDKDDTYNWDDAQSVFIANLNAENYGGFSDWRLPTVKELSFIVNSETYNPVINTAYFSNTMSPYYWSSTTYAGDTVKAWCVEFYYGSVSYDSKSSSYYVRAVRGGQSGPLNDLVINGDGTVTDTSTGLIWQQQRAGEMTWEAAISYCEGLSLGGYDDWRLPNRNELQSLVDYTRYSPAIDTAAFPDTVSSYYWSSTTTDASYNTPYAWCVYFSGYLSGNDKSGSYYVRAVRGGQSGPSVIVAGHTPSGGASGVAIDTVVTVTFNKSMDRASTEAAFSMTPSVSGGITWTADDKTLTFTPAPNLSPGKEYTVSIANSATDTESHKLDSNQNGTDGEPEDTYTFTFTTAAFPIPTPFPNPVPDTGQTQSYTDTFGEDSYYTINPPSYTKLDAQGNDLPDLASSWSMVKDNVTVLIWEGKTDDGSIHDMDDTYNWDDAQSVFIANLNATNFGGFSDWRLPTIKELSSIVNSGTCTPAINTAYFPNTMSLSYWSSTTHAYDTGYAWCVYFNDGHVYFGSKSDYGVEMIYVRAVRGGQSGSLNDLVINGDGTVTDTSTGLIWQQQTAGEMTWEAAISYCEGLSLGGYNDWRLPNRNELQSLVDYTRYWPAIDTAAFPDIMSSGYWSSTTYAYDDTYSAWCVYFFYGDVYSYSKSGSFYVRAVRGGQSGPLDNLVIVAGHTPSGGASGVAIDIVVTVTFNKSMDRTSTEAAFSITPSISGGITWADDDKTLTFTPALNLSPGKEYTVSIAGSATDTESHKLDSNQNGTGGEPENTSIFSFTTEETTLIELDQFTAVPQSKHIAITWITLSEIDNAGFNLWRSEAKDGKMVLTNPSTIKYIKVNPRIIEAAGGATLRAEYSYTDTATDTAAKAGITYYYKLEDIDTKGVSNFHGPISATIPAPAPQPS